MKGSQAQQEFLGSIKFPLNYYYYWCCIHNCTEIISEFNQTKFLLPLCIEGFLQ